MDHIVPCSRGGTELQILCAECHSNKSAIECESARPWSPFRSTFSKSVYKHFAWLAEVPKTPPVNIMVGDVEKPGNFGVDIVRCRANAMRQPGYGWSVFSVYDNIVPSTPHVLCEWSFVDRDAKSPREHGVMKFFPTATDGCTNISWRISWTLARYGGSISSFRFNPPPFFPRMLSRNQQTLSYKPGMRSRKRGHAKRIQISPKPQSTRR